MPRYFLHVLPKTCHFEHCLSKTAQYKIFYCCCVRRHVSRSGDCWLTQHCSWMDWQRNLAAALRSHGLIMKLDLHWRRLQDYCNIAIYNIHNFGFKVVVWSWGVYYACVIFFTNLPTYCSAMDLMVTSNTEKSWNIAAMLSIGYVMSTPFFVFIKFLAETK